ncbi:MAG: efflux RND transporter periplasmic adaptor subunit [Candidatus Kapaibacteriota bacterium]
MNKQIIISKLTLLLPFVLVFVGCASKVKRDNETSEAESSEIPVKILVVQSRKFEEYLTFYSKLSGRIENTKTSMVSDRVEKIFVRAGQYVKEGQLILQFPTNNPSLQFQQAKVSYENALKTYNRFKELLKSGETSQQNFDNIETQFLVAKRNYESLKQILFVEAPISGYVSNLYVTEGQQVDIGKPLFTISVLDRMRAIAYANEQEIQQLRIGMEGRIIWTGKEYPCKIISLAMKMDDAMKGFRVEFEAPNPKLELKSGVTVEIKIKIFEKPNAIVIPKVLIEKDEKDNSYVFVEENGIAKKRIVQTGRINGLDIEILNGIKEGEHIIVEGRNLLVDGAKVKVMK